MERRHILPSSYPSRPLSLDEPNGFSIRKPLADSAANAQPHSLPSTGIYHESKGPQPPVEKNIYAWMPTLPSQPAEQPIANTLETRRQIARRRRHIKYSQNPIVDSPQYQAYRARQSQGNSDDAKWPLNLEMAFLDALMYIPKMGRRKYSFKGKPHGRNELITEYLWIAYLQGLPPGARPDRSMRRERKQVSSHIQVLKGFLRDHPAFDRLFPSKKTPKNGFEDSFKDDPCLIALSEGRLPSQPYDQFENLDQVVMHASMRPVLFWLLITSSSVPDEVNGKDICEEDLLSEGIVAHRFTGLSAQRQRDSLESISSWRQRFPYLQQLIAAGEVQCDIIHMDVSLNLLASHPPEGAELCCQTVLSFSQSQDYEWRIITTLNRPPELYRDPHLDPPVEAEVCLGQATSLVEGETRVKIPFPAVGWANAVTCLTNLQAKYEEKCKDQLFRLVSNNNARPVRDYIDQISMYQEVRSSPGPREPFTRRAVMVWTFHQAGNGEGNGTHWRYLDISPPRHLCMSPPPHASHQMSASMSENFNSWAETPLQLHQNMLDPFGQGLITPPNTAGLQSPFDSHNFSYVDQGFDLPSENISFSSNRTMDSDATLLDHETAANIDHFLSTATVGIGDYDQNATSWVLPATESFDADPAWANYTVPSSTPAIGWDNDATGNRGWNDIPVSVADLNQKQISWTEVEGEKHEWRNELGKGNPVKFDSYVEGIEQKLGTWTEEIGDGEKGPYGEAGDLDNRYIEVEQLDGGTDGNGNGIVKDCNDEKEQTHEWDVVGDGFDYESLAARLKA